MARGRKRKPGKRYPSGKRIPAELQREALSTVVDARQRHYGVSSRQARDQRLGTVLGRLAFCEAITREQFQAGEQFAALVHHHHVVFGMPLPHPRSVTGLLDREGIFGGSSGDPDPFTVDRLRRRYAEATAALDRCDREQRRTAGPKPSCLVRSAAFAEEDLLWNDSKLDRLRAGLDALAELFGIVRS
jgi:hypothetical protein